MWLGVLPPDHFLKYMVLGRPYFKTDRRSVFIMTHLRARVWFGTFAELGPDSK